MTCPWHAQLAVADSRQSVDIWQSCKESQTNMCWNYISIGIYCASFANLKNHEKSSVLGFLFPTETIIWVMIPDIMSVQLYKWSITNRAWRRICITHWKSLTCNPRLQQQLGHPTIKRFIKREDVCSQRIALHNLTYWNHVTISTAI